MIQWEGQPTAFALSVPYIVAFDPTFIEVRHMDTVGRLLIVGCVAMINLYDLLLIRVT